MQSDQANVERQDDCFPFVVSVGKYFLLLATHQTIGQPDGPGSISVIFNQPTASEWIIHKILVC